MITKEKKMEYIRDGLTKMTKEQMLELLLRLEHAVFYPFEKDEDPELLKIIGGRDSVEYGKGFQDGQEFELESEKEIFYEYHQKIFGSRNYE